MTEQELIANVKTLTPLELRTLNRYHLHPKNQRCCSACFTIFDNFTEHFHIKKHCTSGTTAYNTKCAKCFNKVNRTRTTVYRKDPHQFIKSRFSGFRHRAKLIGCPFDLTVEHLQKLWDTQQGLCYYTDTSIDFELITESGKAPHNSTPSLDRLDPAQGYVMGNVVWCAYAINRMKNDFTYEQFLYMCKHITKTRREND